MVTALGLHAQVIDRNDIVISAAPGFSVSYYSSVDSSGTTNNEDGKPGIRTPVSVEYAFGRAFGISIDFIYTRLFPEVDMYPPQSSIFDVGAGLTMHAPWARTRFDLAAEVGVHYSKFHYFVPGDFSNEVYDGNGTALYWTLDPRFYFSEKQHFGMGLMLNGSAYKYPKIHYQQDPGSGFDFKMNALAYCAGLTFFYKL